MLLRLVFTPEDLARVRVTQQVDPMWEIVLSLHQLGVRQHPCDSPYRNWAALIRSMARDQVAPAAAALYELVPPQRYFPDFVTPVPPSTSLEQGIDAVLHVPRSRLSYEMARANTKTSESAWLAGIAAGEPRPLGRLASALRTYHRLALEPFHDQIVTQLDCHRHSITQRLATGGVHAMLDNLAPSVSWKSPVLSAPYPADLTIELAGRGLTLVPSFFCQGAPVSVVNRELDPILVYPIDPPLHWMQPADRSTGMDRHLATLIGLSRATLLGALTVPLTTSQLAARAGLPLSSTSEHTKILRNCGLVASTRQGRHVMHSLTPLGRQILAGGHRWMAPRQRASPNSTAE
jgi:DNA-binding transcriptional ArsR family regulator